MTFKGSCIHVILMLVQFAAVHDDLTAASEAGVVSRYSSAHPSQFSLGNPSPILNRILRNAEYISCRSRRIL